MICAYNKIYHPQARETMGAMFDYVVWDCQIDMDFFFDLFISAGLADRFGNGDPIVLAGKSGPEIAWDVFGATNYTALRPKPRYNLNRSKEYWTGWMLADYQWRSAMPFSEIRTFLPPSRILSLYSPYHERDPRAFMERANQIYHEVKKDSNLKVRREARGMSQAVLAEVSGVPLRTLQQYEQRQKDIRKANVGYVYQLARALCCRIEDILEYGAIGPKNSSLQT